MATITGLVQGTRTILSGASAELDSLGSGNYTSCGNIVCATNDPLDVVIEVHVSAPTTPAGNKQLVVFGKGSLDGTNFESGPETGSTTTDEPDLTFIGTVPVNTGNATHRGVFSLAPAFGGVLPHTVKLVVKNDLGAALGTGGHGIYYAEITSYSSG